MAKKYFGTDGIRGVVNSKYINGDMFFKFGLASGTYFKSQKKRKQTANIIPKKTNSKYSNEKLSHLEIRVASGSPPTTIKVMTINLIKSWYN